MLLKASFALLEKLGIDKNSPAGKRKINGIDKKTGVDLWASSDAYFRLGQLTQVNIVEVSG